MTISAYNNDNYSITIPSVTYEITQATLSLTEAGTTTNTYNGEAYERTITISGFQGSDLADLDLSNISYTLSNNTEIDIDKVNGDLIITYRGTNVGTYTLSISNLILEGNYEAITINDSFNIGAKVLSGTWTTPGSLTESVYDSTTKTLSYGITGLVSGDTVTVNDFDSNLSITRISTVSNVTYLEFDVSEVGSYTVTISAYNNDNYSITIPSVTYEITQATLSLTEAGTTTNTYNGEAYERTITISGFQGSDLADLDLSNISYTLSNNTEIDIDKVNGDLIITYRGTNVGTYTLSISNLTLDGNYEAITIDDSFTISERTTTVSISDNSVTSIDDLVLVFTNLVAGESLDYSITYYSDVNLQNEVNPLDTGTYYIKIVISNINYNLDQSYQNVITIFEE